MKKTLLNFSLFIGGLAIALGVAEAIIRLGGFAPEVAMTRWSRYRLAQNPKIIYEPVPEFEWTPDIREGMGFHERGNSLGYRGPVYPETPQPGNFRILVLGDSIAEGFGIAAYQDVFSAVIERTLRQQGLNAEVMNFGVNGYQTSQEIETLKDKGLRFKPNAVILAYCHNDTFGDDGAIATDLINRSRESRTIEANWTSPLLVKSALYRFVRFRALSELHRKRKDEFWAFREQAGARDTVREHILEFGSLARTHDFRPIIAIFPQFDVPLAPYPLTDKHETVRRFAEEAQVEVVDLLRVFQKCREEAGTPVWKDMYHPNEAGHRCAGLHLADVLKSSSMGSQ